ncbi:MAG: hypothetical protein ONB44_23475 [candidate division KSB1 bacterium]|nr:hypothetical protein [candidate division KSB1 bacterium]MDZ7305103.1 hypothetical protein [candidate division KSB1 bacterium]MDZ7314196.1 hypothetical protein [candidate division KSB1 bacterium]
MKKAIIMCTCSFACPSMKDIDFGELAERIRLEVPHDYMALHPRLCEANGEELLAKVLDNETVYLTPACKEEKQKKLLRDAFQRAGVPMNENWKPVMMSFKNTEQVFEEIQRKTQEVS